MIPRTTVDIGAQEREAIERVLNSGQFVKGKECTLLEEEFSNYQGVKYGAGVNSGTSALHLSLLALDLQPGDEVITTPNTFAATVNSIIIAGAKPKFVDVDSTTFNMDVEKLKEAITNKTKAIIPVHLYGLMADMVSISEIAKEKNIFTIEDACQAHGAECQGNKAGILGDLAAFSFFPTKNATVAGDGGIVVSNNEELINKIKSLRDHGRINGEHKIAGLNNRLSEILAAIGRAHIKGLEDFNTHRRKIAETYSQGIDEVDQINLPFEPEGYKHVYHLYTIKTEKRDELRQFLKENNIGSTIMYKDKLNELEYVKQITTYQELPVNDKISKQILSLPVSGSLELEKIERVAQTINSFFKGD